MSGVAPGSVDPLKPTIKNWHWRTKPVEVWSKEWFGKELVGLAVEGVAIDEVKDVEGDAEVGMRKSKLVTIYDQKITMTWKGTDSEGEDVKGTLVCLEVSHDMDEDDYVFTATLDSKSSKEADAMYLTAKKKLANLTRPIFQKYPKAMLDTHGKDLLTDSPSASGASTPVPPPAATAATKTTSSATITSSSTSKSSTSTKETKATFNTATVKAEAELSCTAEDLFDFLTNEAKIPLWSRNPATMSPVPDAPMRLFGGNIEGKVKSVDKPSNLKTTWRAPTWPEGYYGLLEMELRQGSSSTNLTLRLTGVPVGKEDEAERNLNVYYIQGLKQIGLGTML